VSTPDVAQRIASYRTFVDHQGDRVLERAVAELIDNGDIERHARRIRRVYSARRDVLADALQRWLPALAFTRPAGGLAIWGQLPGVDAQAWAQRGLAEDVSFQPANHFACGPVPLDFVRLGFAVCNELQLAQAVQAMARALPQRHRRSR
jgi:GntR family transcriptional regulator / MocR family aminotransferase